MIADVVVGISFAVPVILAISAIIALLKDEGK